MSFETLKENYTKVSYKTVTSEPKELSDFKTKSNRTKWVLKAVIAGTIFYFTLDSSVFAGSFEEKAEALYYEKFIKIAKWGVIIKGGWETVTLMLKSDFDGAKKGVLQYVGIYLILMGLPKVLDFVDGLFYEEA